MKIEIRNLGKIEQANIDLKPLTVFVGHNGEGKTWAAYSLAAILGEFGFEKYLKAYFNGEAKQTYPIIDQAFEQLFNEGNAQINIVQFAEDFLELYLNDVALLSSTWLPLFMATERISFKTLDIKIDLKESKTRILESIKSYKEERKTATDSKGVSLLTAIKEENKEILYFYTADGFKTKLPKQGVKEFIFALIFVILHRTCYKFNHLLPTERNAFVAFGFTSFNKKISQTESEVDQVKRKTSYVSFPIRSFDGMMNYIIESNFLVSERSNYASKDSRIQKFIDLADFLDLNILDGNLSIENSSLHKELVFQQQEIKYEMSIVSSMIKELAPLSLCLRYLVNLGDMIVIDEPEMNLHPAAQVQIAEFLAMLVNAGLNVLITTHSPYIIDHLGNLMEAAKHKDPESIKDLFYLESSDAFIPKEKVSIYLFEDGTAKNIVNDEGIIDWETFGNVSNDVSRIYSRLINTKD